MLVGVLVHGLLQHPKFNVRSQCYNANQMDKSGNFMLIVTVGLISFFLSTLEQLKGN